MAHSQRLQINLPQQRAVAGAAAHTEDTDMPYRDDLVTMPTIDDIKLAASDTDAGREMRLRIPPSLLDDLFCAAMFAARVTGVTMLSRSGHTVIFAPHYRNRFGRSDISGIRHQAIAQLAHAGIDYTALTQYDLDAYTAWKTERDAEKARADSRVLVTGVYHIQRGRSLVPVQRVALVDGWGEEIYAEVVATHDVYYPDRRNQLGQLGAFGPEPHDAEIAHHLAVIRTQFPDYNTEYQHGT